LLDTDAQVAIKTISKKKFLVNERAVTTTRVSACTEAHRFITALTARSNARRERSIS